MMSTTPFFGPSGTSLEFFGKVKRDSLRMVTGRPSIRWVKVIKCYYARNVVSTNIAI